MSTAQTSEQLVSVIMPSCNSEAYIAESINSVLQQTHHHLELIVVDDGSQDQTTHIIKSISQTDSRLILVIRNQTSGGPAKPRNTGLQKAKGNYLAFIDSDDAWHPRKLEIQLKAMEQFQLNFVSTQHHVFKGQKMPATDTNQSLDFCTANSHTLLIRKNNIITSSAVITKELACGMHFDERRKFIAIEDYAAWLYLHQKPNINSGILPNKLVFYRLRDNSISNSKVMMAKKVFHLLRDYQINGKKPGWKTYYYFFTYIIESVQIRIRNQNL